MIFMHLPNSPLRLKFPDFMIAGFTDFTIPGFSYSTIPDFMVPDFPLRFPGFSLRVETFQTLRFQTFLYDFQTLRFQAFL